MRSAKPADSVKTPKAPSDRTAIFLLVPVATLVVVGLGAMLSASSVVALRADQSQLYFFNRQLVWTVLGVAAFLVTIRIPYRLYAKWAVPLFVVSTVGLIAVLAIGDVRGGARRWIEIGPVTIQPSEFSKFATIVMLAMVLARKDRLLSDFAHFVIPILLTLGTTGGLLMLEPDFGTTMIIGLTGLAMLLASRAPLRYVTGLGAAGGLIGAFFAQSEDYRWRRLTSFLDPLSDRFGDGLQAVQSRIAIATGGWFGVGLGASRARWSFLPNAHTDFIFAIIAEEMGFAGAIVVVVLFVALAGVGVAIALRAPDAFGRLLALGIVSWISIQALINVGGVTVVLPITGVPLPFVSSGGSALITNLAAIGVLVNIARSGRDSRSAPRARAR
ncbi:MAG: putative lipid II flippase FtsW [Acidimicrobiia bacterium]|nr:putative lipid II flippase FtsW [Acidimicrobiia bacterium]